MPSTPCHRAGGCDDVWLTAQPTRGLLITGLFGARRRRRKLRRALRALRTLVVEGRIADPRGPATRRHAEQDRKPERIPPSASGDALVARIRAFVSVELCDSESRGR